MITDMTKGNPTKTLIAFTFPMLIGNLFQQLYNIVDSVVVGNFVGKNALAAVGSLYAYELFFICNNWTVYGCFSSIFLLFWRKKLF